MCEEQRRLRVLVADDCPWMHCALTRLLTPLCDVVDAVTDGAELLEAVVRLRPDVVVLDLNMPGLNGFDACRQVKAVADVNVIVFTADDDPALRIRAVEVGATAFVPKFRAGDDLLPAIQQARIGEPPEGRITRATARPG